MQYYFPWEEAYTSDENTMEYTVVNKASIPIGFMTVKRKKNPNGENQYVPDKTILHICDETREFPNSVVAENFLKAYPETAVDRYLDRVNGKTNGSILNDICNEFSEMGR